MQNIDWKLLKKSVLGETSPEEERSVQGWRNESEEQRKYYDKLLLFQSRIEKEGVDVERNYQDFVRTLGQSGRRRTLRIFKYAAAVCFVGIGILILCLNRPSSLQPDYNDVILAGTSKAILYPGNGKPVFLEKEKQQEILATSAFRLGQQQNTVNYIQTDTMALSSEIHTLKIPHGGEFQLCLSDGTHVYLNAESEIKYPAIFSGSERRITLSGEAYFQVTKSEQPFIVVVNGLEVKVLGTEFNVRAYAGEQNIQTTLVKGKVEVSAPSGKMLLIPGEQAVLTSGSPLWKHEVDVSKYIAWKDGFVAFEDERLEDIMIKLSRWYNIEVFYEAPAMKDIRFTGNIDRYGDIRILLDKIGKLDVVRFAIKGHCITVRPK